MLISAYNFSTQGGSIMVQFTKFINTIMQIIDKIKSFFGKINIQK